MRIKYFAIKCLIACTVMLAAACHKDKQLFEYNPINNLKLETADSVYTVAALDSLIISPKLVEGMPGNEEYTYLWQISASDTYDSNTEFTPLATTKDLRLYVELSPGTYRIIAKVTSNKTGISALARYTLTVTGIYYGGWYVVNTKNGIARVSLIRTDDEVFDNPMETTNDKSYPGKALGLYAYEDGGTLAFFTDQGAYLFNINDWLELRNTATILPGLATRLPFKSTPAFSTTILGYDQFIVADGGVYAGLGASAFGDDALKPFSDRINGDYEAFPGIFSGNLYTTHFYDNKGMKFVQLGYLDRTMTTSAATPSGAFDMANVGKKMIAYDMGTSSYFQSAEFYYVMENTAGARFLLSTTGTISSVSPGIYQQILNSPDIADATKFATSSILKQLYYAAGNKIYVYDMLANSSSLIYTFPSGDVIKDIKMLRSTSTKMVVGINHGNAGEVYYFDIDGQGRFTNNTYTKKFEGFGEIEQVAAARGNYEE